MVKAPSSGEWLAQAARLAARARPLSRPNPAVGAVIVNDGVLVGHGWTQPGGRPHAEAMALDEAREKARGATAYVTLEPCAHDSARGPACANLLIDAGVARVVVGVGDPDPRTAGRGIAKLRAAGIEVELVDDPASRASLSGYLLQRIAGRPHITLKLAMSLDGRIALTDGTSQWITGAQARAHGHRQRAAVDAILVGGETLRADSPSLDVRLPGLEHRSPERWVLTRGAAPEGWHALSGIDDLSPLADIQYLLVEGGGGAAAAFLERDLVDSLLIYRAPIIIGAGRASVGDLGLTDLASAHGRWQRSDWRALGDDMLETYTRIR
ncbi:bifunctional diaminohydroxyphosphoribosylaminopyrimidine deaminase/5-amino-6-(5-phosphoribosylamino)uracil reductase RibD [Pseudoblastomonas halimionae]|uniref:Riboflavin biosynthesis protein RibD n=1 Tax=Alteriqipengyuania halimionae TaxID=1926630 RepID=A0A6I4U2S7_9SPHN|nr:bifunctional diaminohydroxyphosphoribosylaminopyrimidine deaminase/5-amino-6-(5-phosphoribosylamino)uracil reductase RibD [Alteriqipengyuania halimionae]MXP10379.1 bifunctional diaminohydroxyphosphoribosylaminopyrimidine deaminase/5-amino-6-(5-phosphoribosylamino)uracil reductase RibD [Alteriqipengyuania halimionae]